MWFTGFSLWGQIIFLPPPYYAVWNHPHLIILLAFLFVIKFKAQATSGLLFIALKHPKLVTHHFKEAWIHFKYFHVPSCKSAIPDECQTYHIVKTIFLLIHLGEEKYIENHVCIKFMVPSVQNKATNIEVYVSLKDFNRNFFLLLDMIVWLWLSN